MSALANGASPAGFWRRFLAYNIDWMLLALPVWWLIAPGLRQAGADLASLSAQLQDWLLARMLADSALPAPLDLAQAVLADAQLRRLVDAATTQLTLAVAKATLLAGATAAIYFIGFEASPWRATPGKRLLGLSVLDLRGQRLDWRRAALRFFAGSLSWLSLNLGHALAAWRVDGRALHDLIAGTRVVARTPMPRWAWWTLYAQLALLTGVVLAVFGRLLWVLAQLQGGQLP